MESVDWRTSLPSDLRQKVVNKMYVCFSNLIIIYMAFIITLGFYQLNIYLTDDFDDE